MIYQAAMSLWTFQGRLRLERMIRETDYGVGLLASAPVTSDVCPKIMRISLTGLDLSIGKLVQHIFPSTIVLVENVVPPTLRKD